MNTTGIVFHIQRFSLHDGPGIRTTVFLKGCPMRCFWCHNPEGRLPEPEIRYYSDRCIACGACVTACPNHAHKLQEGRHIFLREHCQMSGHCVKTCFSGALEMNGQLMTVEQVMAEVLPDRPFYESSGGGVTLSGGEPAFDGDLAREILKHCKEEGLHTAIETCGFCPWAALEALLPYTDLVMMDLKLITPEKHEAATGQSSECILENARRLTLTDKPVIFRTPIVPNVNDSEEEFAKIVSFVRSLIDARRENGRSTGRTANITYELLQFHKLAADKYRSVGLEYEASHLDPPAKAKMDEYVNLARIQGINARLG